MRRQDTSRTADEAHQTADDAQQGVNTVDRAACDLYGQLFEVYKNVELTNC